MLLHAARRLVVLLVGACTVTTLVGFVAAPIAGVSIDRSVSVSFYAVGSFLLVAGFFVGNRGPVRPKSASEGFSFIPFWGSRSVRWASPDEQRETINLSAVFVVVGFVLVMVGIAIDSRHRLF